MTVAEKKVKEIASKLADQIETCEKSGIAPDVILYGVKCYLSGIDDGISLSEEMRETDYNVQAKVGEERPLVGDGPHETKSGGPKMTIGIVDPKITAVREPIIQVEERDLPWNFGRGGDL